MIFFRFGADASEVEREGKKAKTTLDELRKEFRQGITDAAKWGAAVTAAGIALGTHLVNQAREAIDTQAKLARSLDTTSSSVATLKRASDLAGVSVSGLEQLSKDLTRRLSQAADGTGPAVDALKRLNLTADELARMPLDQRVETINKAIRDFIPAAQQAAVAGQLFGEEGSIAAARLDPETIRAARVETEKFGLALSEVDAAKVEAANDALSGVKRVFDGFIQQITVELAPVIEALSKQFIQTATAGSSIGEKAGESFGFIVDAVGFAMDAIEGFKRAVQTVADTIIIGFAGIQTAVMAPFVALTGVLAQIPGQEFFTEIHETAKARMTETAGVVREAFNNIRSNLEEPLPSESFKQFVTDAKDAAEASAQAVIDARKKMAEQMGAGGDGSFLTEAEIEQLQTKLDALRNAYATEKELLMQKFSDQQELLDEANEQKLLKEGEYLARSFEINDEYQQQLSDLEQSAADKRKAIAEAEKQARLNIAQSIFGSLSTLINSENRKMFELGKAAAIANSLVNTYQAITNALASVPYPANIAAAAAVGLQGFAQVQSIRSQQFGGGGAGAQATGSNSAAVNAASTPVESKPSQTLFVNGLNPGDLFSGEAVRELAGRLVDFQKDGGEVVFAQ